MRKINIILFVIVQALISFYCLSFGDDTSLGLLKGWAHTSYNSFETLLDTGFFKLVKSNVEPIVSLVFGEETFPVLFQARETGFSYILLKLASFIFGPIASLRLMNLVLVMGTYFYLDKICEILFSREDRKVAILLMVLSPVLMYFGGPYYPDKFILFFTVLLAYQVIAKADPRYIISTIILGLLTKFIFILNVILVLGAFLDISEGKKMIRLRSFKIASLVMTIVGLVVITGFYEQFYFEFISDHALLKSLNFNLDYIKHILLLVVDQRTYLNYFVISNVSPFLLVVNVIIGIILFLGLNLKENRRILISLCFYFLLLNFAIYDFSNASDYFSEALILILLLKIKSISSMPKEYKRFITIIVILLSSVEFGLWLNSMTSKKLRPEISIEEKINILNIVESKGIDQIIITNKFDQGTFDYLSNGKMQSSFLNTETLAFHQKACVLAYYTYKFGGAVAGEEQTPLEEVYSIQMRLHQYGYQLEDLSYNGALYAYLGCISK